MIDSSFIGMKPFDGKSLSAILPCDEMGGSMERERVDRISEALTRLPPHLLKRYEKILEWRVAKLSPREAPDGEKSSSPMPSALPPEVG